MEKDVLFGKYKMGKLLGQGAFAKVYFAKNIHTAQSVAIKVINKQKIVEQPNMMCKIEREISIMGRLRHPNIVRLYEVLACKRKIYFVIELAKGGEFYAKAAKGPFTEELSRKYFQQLISAVGYCHFRGVYHRDLKPGNILLGANGKIKVTDFGLSAIKVIKDHIRPDGMLHTQCGTPAYVAPEILRRRGYDGAGVDVWSCGVILYVLTAGYLPFNDPNMMAMYRKIYQGDYRCPTWMSDDLTHFLGRLLETNPKTRITIDEIVHDPWFRKGGLFKDKGPEFEFPFYHDKDRKDLDDGFLCHTVQQLQQQKQEVMGEEASTSTPLNAFDLISFSRGLDLSGLFNKNYNPFEDSEKFISGFSEDEIISTIREVAAELDVKVHMTKKECVMDLVGSIGNFIARVEVNQLTENLVIVEVKIKGGDSDSVSENDIWKKKLMPKLSGLIYDFDSQHVEEIDTATEPELSLAISVD
ncbi:hypothetical protein SOVF_038100 [Spinacia oleracea]|uniref:non-specific serine/threonine protein kinase n=1 Tax=Spinacia oleracea TaxID=3562 RepID=A0A9R0I701_SPIOL|nr:CBL-interacting serine/threonine-protein kinase 11-like [Spinacia oleracea]KNA21999.1 hypothetical protein SOVF_038100 [Spinacia oleracea]